MRLLFWLLVPGSLTHLNAAAYMTKLCFPSIPRLLTGLRFCGFVPVIQTANLLESVLFVLHSNVEAQCSYTAELGIKIFLSNRFYGKNSSYVHGGLDSNGKPADAVYGQSVRTLKKLFFPSILSPLLRREMYPAVIPSHPIQVLSVKEKLGEEKSPPNCRQQQLDKMRFLCRKLIM